MNFTEFCKITEDMKLKHPIWFEFVSRNLPTEDDIISVEKRFNITLNDDYKSFVKRYGGGSFAFVKILTCCSDDNEYILNFNTGEFVQKYFFVSVADLETGDMVGFKINNGVCSEEMYIFNHDDGTIQNMNVGNFFEFILKYGYNM